MTAHRDASTVDVYHPLGRDSELYALYTASRRRPSSRANGDSILDSYRPYAARLAADMDIAMPSELLEDRRELCAAFRRFLPALVGRSAFLSWVANAPIAFPAVGFVDARSVGGAGEPGVIVTAGMLDVVERFADTVSFSVRLCELALSSLMSIEEDPPDCVPLAWLAVGRDNFTFTWGLEDLLANTSGAVLKQELRREVFERVAFDWLSRDVQRGLGRYYLSHYLNLLMLRRVGRSVRSGRGDEGAAASRIRIPKPDRSPLAVDAGYLAVLALTFIVFHEFGHLAMRHNEIIDPAASAEGQLADQLVAAAKDLGADSATNLVGSTTAVEFAADVFAIEVLDTSIRHPLLEAATLWCAALASAYAQRPGQLEDIPELATNTSGYPSFGRRVWFLNGRLSTGARQGQIARIITESAIDLGREAARTDIDPAREQAVFAALVEIASAEIAAARPSLASRFARRAFGRQILPAAGSLERSEAQRLFDTARKLGDQGQMDAAETCLRRAHDLGHPAAANSLGVTLEQRGELEAALAAYRRADERGDRDGAFNLGRLLRQTADLGGAEAAFQRAGERGEPDAAAAQRYVREERERRQREEAEWRRGDTDGDAEAAYRLGIRLYQTGASDEGEAAIRRADERGHAAAARELGVLLKNRGEITEAEDALRRADERGDTGGTNSLGALLEARGDRAGAIAAYQRADASGSEHAAFNIARLLQDDGDRAAAVAAYRRADERGHPEAAANLGVLLQQQGDLMGAEAAYRRGDQRGDGVGAFNLGLLLEARGDGPGAEAAFRRGADRGDARAAAKLRE
jgi:tetratricopeptide (TPR) repeat protein